MLSIGSPKNNQIRIPKPASKLDYELPEPNTFPSKLEKIHKKWCHYPNYEGWTFYLGAWKFSKFSEENL